MDLFGKQCCISDIDIYLDPSSDDSGSSESDEESEYETEIVYQLKEWYPPDHAKSKGSSGTDEGGSSITLVETRSKDGALIKEMRIQAKILSFLY